MATSGSPHTLSTAGFLLESGSTEPLRVEENTCLHFHRFDVGLLLFFACEEGRTKGLSAELQEWLRGPTLRLGCLPWGQESSNRVVVPVSNLTAHHVPGTALDPRTQSTAGAEKGLGQTTKARAVASSPWTVRGTQRGPPRNTPRSCSRPELPSGAQPPLALEWNNCLCARGPGQGSSGVGATGARLW